MASSGLNSGYAADKKNVAAPGVKSPDAPKYGQRANETPGAYQGNLNTDFSGYGNNTTPNLLNMNEDQINQYMDGFAKYQRDNNSNDGDVKRAASLSWEIQNPNSGTDGLARQAELNAVLGRIGEKNTLAEQIRTSDDQLAKAQDINKATAGSTLEQSLRRTRENYSGRGLLYSGLRQGDEQKAKAGVASQLATTMSGTARDAANSKQVAKNAYASVDLANRQETVANANAAFDTASANNIARLQALQQLGSGLGSAAGTIYGNYRASAGTGSGENPAAGFDFNGIQRTGLLADGKP